MNDGNSKWIPLLMVSCSLMGDLRPTFAQVSPWIAIREETIGLTKQHDIDLKKVDVQKISSNTAEQYHRALVEYAQPFTPNEIFTLAEFMQSVAHNYEVDVTGSAARESIFRNEIEKEYTCEMAVARFIKTLPPSQRDSILSETKILNHLLINRPLARIIAVELAFADPSDDGSRLQRFILLNRNSQVFSSEVSAVIPFMLLKPYESMIEDLEWLNEYEKIKHRFGGVTNQVAQYTINAEGYCRTLLPNRQKSFRNFYARLHRAYQWSPSGFRDSKSTYRYFAEIMPTLEGDEEFYLSFLQNWEASPSEQRCIQYLYGRIEPRDVEELKRIASNGSPAGRIASEILTSWDKP